MTQAATPATPATPATSPEAPSMIMKTFESPQTENPS
jgi:hypothetical protein